MPYARRNLGHHGGCGGCGRQPRCQDVFVQEGFSNEHGIEGNNNGEHNASGESDFTNNAYEIREQGNRQSNYRGLLLMKGNIIMTCILKEKQIHGLTIVMMSMKDHRTNPFKVINKKASKKMSCFLP